MKEEVAELILANSPPHPTLELEGTSFTIITVTFKTWEVPIGCGNCVFSEIANLIKTHVKANETPCEHMKHKDKYMYVETFELNIN